MSDDFFKFPRTPHIYWPIDRPTKEDRVLTKAAAAAFLDGIVVVEEKVDGANVGLSIDSTGLVRAQNRGSWIDHGVNPQFRPLWAWITRHERSLIEGLGKDFILFGEWCFAVHTVFYSHLPDWFLGFDVYDRKEQKFLCTRRRDALLKSLGVFSAPRVSEGYFTLAQLAHMLEFKISAFGTQPIEGFYLRKEDERWLSERAKMVRPEFMLEIDQHWSKKDAKLNKLGNSRPPG